MTAKCIQFCGGFAENLASGLIGYCFTQCAKWVSSTIKESAQQIQSVYRVAFTKCHYLSDLNDTITTYQKELAGTVDNYLLRDQRLKRDLRRYFVSLRRNSRSKIKLIAVVRDPVAIAISDFFVQAWQFSPFEKLGIDKTSSAFIEYLHECLSRLLSEKDSSDNLLDQYLYFTLTMASRWLEHETENLFGVDVFSTPFDFDKKYLIIRGKESDLLCMRAMDIDSHLIHAVRDFVQIDLPGIVQSNVTADQAGGICEQYRNFLSSVVVSQDFVADLYALPFVQHSYTREERQALAAKWTGT